MPTFTGELLDTYELFEDERTRYKDSTYDIVSKVLCNRCQHKGKGITCKAFPNGIPMEILRSGEHYTPVSGDHGVVFLEKHATAK